MNKIQYIVYLTGMLLVTSLKIHGMPLKSEFYFRHLTNQDGLSSSTINRIIQGPQGYMWFATSNGLNRFDGYRIKAYLPDDAIPHSISHRKTTAFLIDNDENLLIGTIAGIQKYNPNTDAFSPYIDEKISMTPTRVTVMYQDVNNSLWVGTYNQGLWIISDEGRKATQLTSNDISMSMPLSLTSNNITAITANNDELLWIATEVGLNVVDRNTLKKVKHYNVIQKMLSNLVVLDVQFSSDNTLWIATERGLYRADTNNDTIVEHYFENTYINSMLIGDNHEMWLGTRNGAIKIDLSNNSHVRIRQDPADPDSVSGQIIHTIYQSEDGIIWLGSHAHGVDIFNPESTRFGHFKSHSEQNNCISSNLIYASLIDSQGDIWLGSTGAGLNRIAIKSNTCTKFDSTNTDIAANALLNIVDMTEDSNGDIWFATYNQGLVQFDRSKNIFFQYLSDSQEHSISSNWIRSVNVDSTGNVWLGSYYGGLIRYNPDSGLFKTFNEIKSTAKTLDQIYFNAIAFDKRNHLWLATSRYGVMSFDPIAERFHTYSDEGLSDIESVYALAFDSKNNLWIASDGQGVFKFHFESASLTRYQMPEGLNSDLVYQLKLDSDENVWVSSSGGISKIDSVTEKIVSFNRQDGLQNNEFTNAGSFSPDTGQMLFAGVNGINLFDPKQIETKVEHPRLVISGLSVPGLDSLSEQKAINYSTNIDEEINLPHNLNLIQLEFAGLHYANPQRHRYAYRIMGLEDRWTEVAAHQRNITFSNLAAGQYNFQFRATDRSGNWSPNIKALTVNIARAPWLSWWAFSLYGLILMAVITTILTLIWRKQVATHQKLAAEQLNATKDRLFANVSHEFRTPLSLIIAPVSLLLSETKDNAMHQKLTLVMRHAKRLSQMVDQFLSLAKLEMAEGEDKQPQELSALLQSLYTSFIPLCENKNLSHSLLIEGELWISAVPDSMEIVLTNLISNAIKYTQDNGQITIQLEQLNGHAVIKVQDNGYGISPKNQEKVFERFTRVVSDEHSHIHGTGVGLALTKELVEKNGGQIQLQSALDEGSTFTLTFLTLETLPGSVNTDNVFKAGESTQLALDVLEESIVDQNSDRQLTIEEEEHSKRTLLIIEDNADIRQLLGDLFSQSFHCLTAKTGKQGLELGISHIPDIIITDLMMPELNGFQVVERLRENELTCHIPIIMLTARQDIESRIKGWEKYVDAYLTKPFLPKEILLVANNLLHIRKLTDKNPATSLPDTSIDMSIHHQINEKDQLFLDKFNSVIEEQFNSLLFSRKIAAESLFITEKQLSRKLKALQDSNFTDYLRDYRLERAKEQINTGKQVAQISDDVGFTSPSYFIKCFRQKYGITPHKYMNQIKE